MGYGFRNYGNRGPSYRTYGGGGGGGGFTWHITPTIKKLIYINLGVFLFTLLLQIFSRGLANQFIMLFGLVPNSFLHGYLWQPFTYLFLHGGFMHLFFNMFGLWMFGMPLERDWGRRRFLKYYFLTGVGAGLFSVLMTWITATGGGAAMRAMLIPTIGASGAIYGILLAFGLLYPNAPILVMFLFPIPARIFVMIYGGITFINALGQSGSGVSHVAHLGGMIFGFLYLRGPSGVVLGLRKLYAGWQLNRARRKFRVYERDIEERDRRRGNPDDWVN